MKHTQHPANESSTSEPMGQRLMGYGCLWEEITVVREKLQAQVSMALLAEARWCEISPAIGCRFWQILQDLLDRLAELCQQLEEGMTWLGEHV